MNTKSNVAASGGFLHRIVRPIPSDIRKYTQRIEKAQASCLGAGLCGDYEACDKHKAELRQLLAELAAWCGCDGTLADCRIGMGTVTLDGKHIIEPNLEVRDAGPDA
jgi:hypothetical protein